MKKIELLAPCGSMESLYAAVQNGADAVYLGGSRFSARAYAFNFDDEKIIEAVDYCHLYGVKVYVTVNTLVKDSEMKDISEYVKFLYTIGVDALIIQDTGLAYLIRKNFPDFEIHGSTQMTIHNGEGAQYFKDLGFHRIVLSRELSLKEIEFISKDLNIETEIFVHGALCVCYSGQCLMSSVIGGRSGNRGRCAQPCRLPYTLINENNKEEFKGYILSPKDMCTLDNIEEIIKSGTSSLKIEGRMKKPEYVAGVVGIYRKAIDSVYNNSEFDYELEVKKLKQLFNREGFSKAYMFGNIGKDMMSYSFPKNTGLFLGSVNKDLTITLAEDLNIKDGVRVKNDGFSVSKILINGSEIQRAHKGDRVKLVPHSYAAFDEVYKTSDMMLLDNLYNSFRDAYGKKIDIDIQCKFKIDEPFEVMCHYNGKAFKVTGDLVQKAIKKPLEKIKLEENLIKTGNTPFRIQNIDFLIYEEGFLPLSAVNAVRRNLTHDIIDYEYKKSKRVLSKGLDFNREEKTDKSMEKLMVSVENLEQLNTCIDSGVKAVIIDLFHRKNNISIENINNVDVYLRVPNIIKEEFDFICSVIDDNINRIKGIVTANAGIINRYKNNIDIIGDYKLNLFNKYALDFYSKDLSGSYISIELNRNEIMNLIKNSPIPCGMIIYGKFEVMVSEYCPIGSTLGGKCTQLNCNNKCDTGEFKLKDRIGEEFIVKTDKFCRSHIYNSVPLNLIPNLRDINSIGNINHRIDFVDEKKDEVIEILEAYSSGKFQYESKKFTRGHYKRGVE
ncbi:U32 family peptidase [Clostridium sp.]|uniref:U32 family peptidase n=1 Tax=Clostridium sp. TaxID=1506 RepID=UPI002590E8A9|nr:U32 family peptidase [Clostridium sp.]MDF2504121.1 collagenase-like protease [Clostridium sp.]